MVLGDRGLEGQGGVLGSIVPADSLQGDPEQAVGFGIVGATIDQVADQQQGGVVAIVLGEPGIDGRLRLWATERRTACV